MLNAPLTIGIEEEYQIIDPKTRALTSFVQQMMSEGQAKLGEQVKPEFMESQIEVGSHICRNIAEARQEIVRLRKSIYELAQEHGNVIAAASTHPFSRWDQQRINEGQRYKELETNMQEVGRRLLIFGMHVHVGFGKTPEALNLMIDIQNQLRYFLPHILALSTSSPFWMGRDTGLKSYRSVVFKSMPRTGIPPSFEAYSEYEHLVRDLGKVGSLGGKNSNKTIDATKIWWDARPQIGFGTLEVRISDICTKVDEAICLAALIQAIVAKLIKLRNQNMSWRVYRSSLIEENKWRAVRYGIDGKLIDFGQMAEIPMRFLAQELINFVDDVLDELGSRKDVEYIHTICEEGTSSDRQLLTYRKSIKEGAMPEEALHNVVDQIIQETHADWQS